jgi:FkbM family methyltransferase
MSLRKNLGFIYILLPYISPVRNKLELIFSIFFNRSKYKIKLKDNMTVYLKSSQFEAMLYLLGILTFSTSYSMKSNNEIEFSLDTKNKFSIVVNNMSREDHNMLELLFEGIKYGANFVFDEHLDFKKLRDKTFKIFQKNNKKIIETSEGIKFYIDSINPGNTIIETFVRDIHNINSHDDWNGKVVIDVGAECGDTPLYFANKGAKVYAFEPIKEYFDAMLRNIELNPQLSERIIPIQAGIGKDGDLTFYQSSTGQVGATSFVSNLHGKNVKEIQAKGYSLGSALKEFNINRVELLKMDCKGCEAYLTKEELSNVNKVKIEYSSLFEKSHTLKDLLQVLDNAGFDFVTYSNQPTYHKSFMYHTNIFGRKN